MHHKDDTALHLPRVSPGRKSATTESAARRKVKLTGRERFVRLTLVPGRLEGNPHERHIRLNIPIRRLRQIRWPVLATSVLIAIGAGLAVRQRLLEGYARRSIASFFTAEVQFWSPQIGRWAEQYGLDPNLIATIMQIESCGLADAISGSGAQGLFQVMPMHFAASENTLDPETNARRGIGVLHDCLNWTKGDIGLALACYNGGPSVINRPFATWPVQTQRYYVWGVGLYNDAQARANASQTLDRWLSNGGSNLCERAKSSLNISSDGRE
ncbi:MAG TPA: lytic transglycosylase domain-containing protein [Aggregatilineales bacterium]|nr:lytic transglycosylase domain-containing protein [Aggregatilineales bacterium]